MYTDIDIFAALMQIFLYTEMNLLTFHALILFFIFFVPYSIVDIKVLITTYRFVTSLKFHYRFDFNLLENKNQIKEITKH